MDAKTLEHLPELNVHDHTPSVVEIAEITILPSAWRRSYTPNGLSVCIERVSIERKLTQFTAYVFGKMFEPCSSSTLLVYGTNRRPNSKEFDLVHTIQVAELADYIPVSTRVTQ